MAETSQASLPPQSMPVARATILWADASDGALGSYPLFVLSSSLERNSMVTEHPVEEGVNLTDHVRPEVDHLTVDVFVTNEPFGDWPDTNITRQNVKVSLPQSPAPRSINGVLRRSISTGQISPAVYVNNKPIDYVTDALATFTALRDTATLITVVLARNSFPNMLLQRIMEHRDKSTGTGADYTLEFRGVRFVTSMATDAPTPETPKSTPEKEKGNVAPVGDVKSVARWIQIWAGGTP